MSESDQSSWNLSVFKTVCEEDRQYRDQSHNYRKDWALYALAVMTMVVAIRHQGELRTVALSMFTSLGGYLARDFMDRRK